jgi:hypothetical protein
MVDRTNDPLGCFGDLEKVFPLAENGFRTSPAECMKCSMVKPCIQAAMRGLDGLKEKEKRIDRAYECGLIGTLERWSQKKLIRRKIQRQEKLQKDTRNTRTPISGGAGRNENPDGL